MMPAEGTVDGNKVTLLTRPRTGRTAVFAKSELTATVDKMTATIDTDKGSTPAPRWADSSMTLTLAHSVQHLKA